MYLINGKLTNQITANDRGLQFGDGCFTVARFLKGTIFLFSRHIERLSNDCKRLAINFNNWEILIEEMRSMASSQYEGVLKVIITRGNSKRGYSSSNCQQSTRILNVSSYPTQYAYWKTQGITLTVSPITLGRNPYLAGIKHLNRLEQVLIYNHIEQSEANEALVLDSNGWVIECCSANLFWRKANVVYTPLLNQAGVKGIMRQFCLDKLKESFFQVFEINAKKDVIMQADEIIICNALMPVVPVHSYDKNLFFSRKLFNFLSPLCENSG